MEDYNFIYQFDGNLTDDTGKTTLSVDSGTPSYVTGDNGQALVGNSAALSVTFPKEKFSQRPIHFVFNLRFNTGGTDGNIFTLDTGSKTFMQFNRAGTTLETKTYDQSQTVNRTGTENLSLDTWLCFGVSLWDSTPYSELEPGTGGSTFSTYYDDWIGSDYGTDVKFYVGQTGNASGATGGVTTVATGVDIDFAVFDNGHEGYLYSNPLGAGFEPRTPTAFPVNNADVTHTGVPITLAQPALNANITDAVQTVALGGGGGGPVAPAIKEFWS